MEGKSCVVSLGGGLETTFELGCSTRLHASRIQT